jgi:hypothetical protein
VVGLDHDDPEAFMPTRLAPRGLAASSGEKRLHRAMVIADGLLLNDRTAGCEPGIVRAGLSQLPATLVEPRHWPTPWLPVGLLLNAKIPHIPGMRAVLQQDRFLIRSDYKPVS